MNTMTLVYIIIAFAVGIVVGWLTMIVPTGGRNGLTRRETERLNQLINRAMNIPRSWTLTLYSEGELIDQVTIGKDHDW